jgi:hypothetical protein
MIERSIIKQCTMRANQSFTGHLRTESASRGSMLLTYFRQIRMRAEPYLDFPAKRYKTYRVVTHGEQSRAG